MPEWDRYEDLLLDAMQAPPLHADAPGAVYRALFQPAFHADTCVTLVDSGAAATVEVVVAGPGVRVPVMQAIGVRFGPGSPVPAPGGALHGEDAAVPPDALRAFRQAVAGLDWAALAAAPDESGRDGLPVRGEVSTGGAVYRFHTWSPTARRAPDAYRYCLALLVVAQASVRAAPSRQALRDLAPDLRAE